MRKVALSLVVGALLAIAAQTFIAIAETWSFGPSLEPLRRILGFATFPVVTAVSLGLPIGLLFFGAARVLRASQPSHLLCLIAPFGALQLVGLFVSAANAYALFYAAMFIGMGTLGVVAQWRAASSSRRPRLVGA